MDEFSTKAFFYRLTKSIWYLFSLVEFLLLIRFILFIFAANDDAGFTRFIYGVTQPFIAPFQNVFDPIIVDEIVIDPNIFLALFVYYIIVWAVIRLILMARPVEYHDQKPL